MAHDIDPAVVLCSDGWFRAIDQNTYDVDCDQDGFFSTSPTGYGHTPLDAIIDLLDNMAPRPKAETSVHWSDYNKLKTIDGSA